MIVNALGREWSWPPSDVKCKAVVFEWSKDLAIVYRHCRNFRTAIQAGGNMGVWPWLLAKKFASVVTAEPELECLFHLRENLKGVENVTVLPYALGAAPGTGKIAYVPGNLGAQWVEPGDAFEIVAIDSLARGNVDLIYLDIEGFEMAALLGARETIARDRPTIVVEDKGLSEKFGYKKGDIEKWLGAEFGYKVVARPHRDVVMVCES